MEIKRVIIVTNGKLEEGLVGEIKKGDFVIGVDWAAYWLVEQNIIPDLAIGDFDSTTEEEMLVIKNNCKNIKIFETKKDFTDTELAVEEAIKLKPKEVIIYGATGTRMDHTLANIFLLEKFLEKSIFASIRDKNNEIYLVDDKLILKKEKDFPFVSVIPITDLATVSLRGFEYELDHKVIKRGEAIGVSNEIAGESGEIVVHQGKVMVVRSKD